MPTTRTPTAAIAQMVERGFREQYLFGQKAQPAFTAQEHQSIVEFFGRVPGNPPYPTYADQLRAEGEYEAMLDAKAPFTVASDVPATEPTNP